MKATSSARFLLHFTKAANLAGIVKHGLWPRRNLAAAEHLAYASDYGRLDGNEDAVSVSISRVNEPMFAAKRRKSGRSEEHTTELKSLMRISYAVFCLKKKNKISHFNTHDIHKSNTY